MKNQGLLANFPVLKTHLFLHVMIRSVTCRGFALRHVIAGIVDPNAIYGYNTGRTLQF